MAYVPTTFVDRSVEFPNRRTLTAVSGQADTFDVARAEGTVFAEGTKPDAANLNAEFGKIKAETDAINTSLNTNMYSLSTSEKWTGLYDETDGTKRKIYEKSFALASISTNILINHGITNFLHVVWYHGNFTESSQSRPIPSSTTSEDYKIYLNCVDTSQISLTASSYHASNASNIKLHLYYVKSAD